MNPCVLLLPLAIGGCTGWHSVLTPMPELLEGSKAPKRVRLTGAWGKPIVMHQARFREDSVHGMTEWKSTEQKIGSVLLGRSIFSLVPRSVAVRDVSQVEVRRLDGEATAGAVLVAAGAVGAMLLYLTVKLNTSP